MPVGLDQSSGDPLGARLRRTFRLRRARAHERAYITNLTSSELEHLVEGPGTATTAADPLCKASVATSMIWEKNKATTGKN
jgi:hypothetical protein